MISFNKPIETGIQLGNPTFLTVYENKVLHLLIIDDGKLLMRIPQKDFGKFQVKFNNDMVSGAYNVNIPQLASELEKPHKNLWVRVRRELKRNFELLHQRDYDLLTTWIFGTFLYTEFFSYPYLHFHAPKASGKSTVLRTLEKICFSGQMVVDMTPAIARDIDGEKPTLLIDETEELFETRTKSERIQKIKQILNTGYQKGAKYPRHYLDKKTNKYYKEFFYVYCPKAFASIRELDNVLRDRCLSFNLIRSKKHFTLRQKELTDLMHEILAYTIKNHNEIIKLLPEAIKQLKKNKVYGRYQELMLPLVAIGLHFKQDLIPTAKRITESKIKYETAIQSDEQVIVQALYEIMETKAVDEAYVNLYDIKDEMQRIYERTAEWLTNHYLGHLMQRLGFTETTRRGSTGRTHFLVRKEDVSKLVYAYNVQIDWEGKKNGETIQDTKYFKDIIAKKSKDSKK